MKNGKTILAITALSIMGISASSAIAGKSKTALPENSLSLMQLQEIALEAVPGDIIEYEVERENGQIVAEFEIVTDKSIIEVIIDPQTGDVLSQTIEEDNDDWFDLFDDDEDVKNRS